jgi:hypothetical protein
MKSFFKYCLYLVYGFVVLCAATMVGWILVAIYQNIKHGLL